MDSGVREQLRRVALGEHPADLVLRGGRVVNVFSGTIEAADIAVAGGYVAGIGSGYVGLHTRELNGAFVAPGLIDAHVHIESSLCGPAEFASAVVPRGVTTAVIDPHEIANVAGVAGVRYMAEAARNLPLHVIVMAPSCVPATHLAQAGSRLDAVDLITLLRDGIVHGLAEVMNFPGVLGSAAPVVSKLDVFSSRPIDGHAPGLSGRQLCAYVASGIGSDHEATTPAEAREKLARGLYLLIREASNARNLDALLPAITPANSRRICFCTDDRQPADLLDVGSVDHMVRRAIEFGIEPVQAFQMATLNTAEWFGLHDRGAIAPGRCADLMIFDDLQKPYANLVYARGELVAEDGKLVAKTPTAIPQGSLRGKCDIDAAQLSLKIPARSGSMNVIGLRVDQLITDHLRLPPKLVAGQAVACVERDILKIAVINRHGSGGIGLGFIKGVGLRSGAIAGTVAHDHHNLIVIGVDDNSMTTAIAALAEMGGGLVAVDAGRVMARLLLPIAGLMSDQPIETVRSAYDRLRAAARKLGSPLHDPFMAMSFAALEVIPSLKLTDLGLVDVDRFELIDLFV